ncbi:ATP-dependent DNA helicase RecG [Diplocloster hominis]|uniref:ATP-dependent DNA helicase RecG n=1 Tax=Diplocloster hominis TaxID=3079010 RepID=UPI0031BA0F67
MERESSVEELKGVGPKTAQLFRKIDVISVGDLLEYYPRAYDIYEAPVPVAQLVPEKVQAVSVAINGRVQQKKVKNLQILTVRVADPSGDLQVTWFNMPFLSRQLLQGSRYILRGRVVSKDGHLTMDQPELFTVAAYMEIAGTMRPQYALTAGLSNSAIVRAVKQALKSGIVYAEFLPAQIRKEFHLAEYNYSIQNIHFPTDQEALVQARHRLVFEEFFLFLLALRRMREEAVESVNAFDIKRIAQTDQLIAGLPYALTGAQQKVWQEIQSDMTGHKVMSRLIQGDVGSGKTILAILALMLAAGNGYQGALMVPTEVLARQHYESINSLFASHQLSYRPVLLTGSMTAKEKREVYSQIESKEADIIIGTHALIQEKVNYRDLALVVTDEQHRFGVRQRETLSNKGREPHVLVMSATPIPRTLALIIYGDLDISVINELPATRRPIKNCVVGTGYRPKAYDFISREIRAGRQAYIICPMVEESESIEAENVIDYTRRLRDCLPDIAIEYLHGKMKPAEKNSIMERFASGEIQVLVSTTVVEVGVNVPNATVMMVENAERFGLAQLHQLRGRVGRGAHQSYCIFVSGNDQPQTMKRLNILNQSNDGFHIASEDLKLRGPGDLFGIRQSGLLEFRIGDVFTDVNVLQQANEAAAALIEEDETLSAPEHTPLLRRLNQYISRGTGKISM